MRGDLGAAGIHHDQSESARPRLLEPAQAVVHREAGEVATLHGDQRVRPHEEPHVGVFEALTPGAPAPEPRALATHFADWSMVIVEKRLCEPTAREPRAGEAERERRGVALRAHEQGNRFGPVLVEDRAQPRRDLVDRLVGGDRLQAVGPVALRGEEPVGRMVQLAEMTTLGAREAPRQRVIGIAGDVDDPPVVDVDEQPAERRADATVRDSRLGHRCASAEMAARSSSLNDRSRAATFSSRWAIDDVPGMGSMTGERASSHAERDLLRRRVLARRDRADRLVVGRDRTPGQERDAVLLAHLEDTLGTAIGRVVAILDGRDGRDGQRGREMLAIHVRQADLEELAFVAQLDERADRLLEGHLRIGCVQLVQVDGVDAEPAQAGVAHASEVFGPAVGREHRRSRRPRSEGARDEATFGRDEHVVGVGNERLGDDLLTRPVAVDVGGVDELHAEVDRAPHQLRRRLTRTHHPHRAETETRHLAVADHDRPGARNGAHEVQRRTVWSQGEP